MSDYALEKARILLADADNVFVLAGAGMSAELGSRVYWTGPEAKYGNQLSPFGYTDLQHAHENLWFTDLDAQLAYFNQTWKEMLELDFSTPTSPYQILRKYLEEREKNYFVLTTNVDSAFVKSGWDETALYELHGTYRNSQCLDYPKRHGVFLTVEPKIGLAVCPHCGTYARPNVLFFDDHNFNPAFLKEQAVNLQKFQSGLTGKSIVLEIGAGDKVPTLRTITYRMNVKNKIPVIRINPATHAADLDGRKAPYIKMKETAQKALSGLLQEK